MRNHKCFAGDLGGCSCKISAEHYVSDALLKKIGETNSVSGLAWLPENEERCIGNSSLTSKILCERHNRDLSVLDSEAAGFFEVLQEFNMELNSNHAPDRRKVNVRRSALCSMGS